MTNGNAPSVAKFLLDYSIPKGIHNRKEIEQRLTLTNKEIEKFESGMSGKDKGKIIFCILWLPSPCNDCSNAVNPGNVQAVLLRDAVYSFHLSCFDKTLDQIIPYNRELKELLRSSISEFQDYNLRRAV